MNDIGGVYAEGRARVTEMVLNLAPADAARIVPACPGWTVHDVIAHLAGGCAEVLAGNIDGVTTAEWADAQVRRRRDHTMTQLLEEWSDVAPRLEAISEHFPSPLPTIWVLDLTAHEHDVRGALGRPGARDSCGLQMAVEFLVREGLHRQLVGRELGPLVVRTPGVSWTIGGQAPSARAVATVGLSLFELFRALTGRRSAAQIARYDWTSDPSPFLAAFEFGTFSTRTADLDE